MVKHHLYLALVLALATMLIMSNASLTGFAPAYGKHKQVNSVCSIPDPLVVKKPGDGKILVFRAQRAKACVNVMRSRVRRADLPPHIDDTYERQLNFFGERIERVRQRAREMSLRTPEAEIFALDDDLRAAIEGVVGLDVSVASVPQTPAIEKVMHAYCEIGTQLPRMIFKSTLTGYKCA